MESKTDAKIDTYIITLRDGDQITLSASFFEVSDFGFMFFVEESESHPNISNATACYSADTVASIVKQPSLKETHTFNVNEGMVLSEELLNKMLSVGRIELYDNKTLVEKDELFIIGDRTLETIDDKGFRTVVTTYMRNTTTVMYNPDGQWVSTMDSRGGFLKGGSND